PPVFCPRPYTAEPGETRQVVSRHHQLGEVMAGDPRQDQAGSHDDILLCITDDPSICGTDHCRHPAHQYQYVRGILDTADSQEHIVPPSACPVPLRTRVYAVVSGAAAGMFT